VFRFFGSGFGGWLITGGIRTGADEAAWASDAFDFDSLYWAKEPRVGIFLRFRPHWIGLDRALSRCSVLPDFSVKTKVIG